MQETNLRSFLINPKSFIRDAVMDDTFTKVICDDGRSAIIINDTEWTMLTQALQLCMEHPEWTATK